MIWSLKYSCDRSACTILDDGEGVTSAYVLAAWACFHARDCNLKTRLKPFASCDGTDVGKCGILRCSLVGYALGVSSLSFMRSTTRCSLSVFCGVEAYVTRSWLMRSTVPSSRFITMVFPFTISNEKGPAANGANL